MITATLRGRKRSLLAVLLCLSLATTGCVTTDAESSFTPEQQQLREQKARWNQTVATGAVAGAATGTAIGAVAGKGSLEGILIGAVAGLVVGTVAGMVVADRNLEFEKRELSAEQRIAAARTATQNLETRAGTSEALARSNRARLDQLDSQYRANLITADKYRAETAVMRKDVELIRESAEDAKKARDKIVASSAQVPQLKAEEPKMGSAQRRMENSANQIEEKLNRIPST